MEINVGTIFISTFKLFVKKGFCEFGKEIDEIFDDYWNIDYGSKRDFFLYLKKFKKKTEPLKYEVAKKIKRNYFFILEMTRFKILMLVSLTDLTSNEDFETLYRHIVASDLFMRDVDFEVYFKNTLIDAPITDQNKRHYLKKLVYKPHFSVERKVYRMFNMFY
jgi:hypothetical protein